MADITPTRKSGRKRERSKKYTDDLYETLNLEISDGDDLIPSRRPGEDAQDDEDFDAGQVFGEPDLSVEENLSVAEASEGSPIATPDESEREEMSDDRLSEEAGKPKRKKKWKPPPEVHFRGLAERRNEIAHGSEGGFIDSVIGTAKVDVATYLKARDMWANNISLPSKHIGGRDSGGMRHPFNHTPKQRETEATVGWNWYHLEGGKVSFQQRQTTRVLSAEESARYVPKLADSSHGVLMGPYGKQKLFSLTFLQCLNIDDAWSQARAANPTPSGFTPLPQTPSKRQDGWVLNVASSVQCLDWAPNHTNTQYLAISILQAKKMPQQGFSNTAPAYTPQPGPSSIQIWAVAKSDIEGEDAYLPLQLSLVICTEWGHATQLKWCPMPRVAQDNEAESRILLGLLASVWADGCARVLDVYLEAQKDDGTQYVKYDVAPFESKPADAMCTCVDWLSPTDIAVGCSNGYVAIWKIFPSEAATKPPTRSPGSTGLDSDIPTSRQRDLTTGSIGPYPYIYTFLHSTYILAICSAYPTHPHLITTSSVTGYLRLTDIRSPSSDYVLSQRSHWTPNNISYCAALSSFVTYEDGGLLKLYPIRRFWTSVGFAKGDSEALCVAVGRLHPTVLVGFADGTLLAINPFRRFINTRVKAMLQQKVWKHEWARQQLDTTSQQSREEIIEHGQASSPNVSAQEPYRRGQNGQASVPSGQQNEQPCPNRISRITEGYKIEALTLAPIKASRTTKDIKDTENGFHALWSTIYDAETGIRQVVWNPNEGWGGWAASGMGSGLVRIENLAV